MFIILKRKKNVITVIKKFWEFKKKICNAKQFFIRDFKFILNFATLPLQNYFI